MEKKIKALDKEIWQDLVKEKQKQLFKFAKK